jgi:hypothetical protein
MPVYDELEPFGDKAETLRYPAGSGTSEPFRNALAKKLLEFGEKAALRIITKTGQSVAAVVDTKEMARQLKDYEFTLNGKQMYGMDCDVAEIAPASAAKKKPAKEEKAKPAEKKSKPSDKKKPSKGDRISLS